MPGAEAREETLTIRGVRSCASFQWSSSSTRIPGMGFDSARCNPRAQATWLTSCGRGIYDVTIGPTLTSVERDGTARFEANAGVVVRNYSVTPKGLSFSINTVRDTRISTMEARSGSVSLVRDGGAAHNVPVRNGAVVFTVPAGSHSISEAWGDR